MDLADFELVAGPAAQPANSVSVTAYGADPSGAGDAGPAFDQAINAARSSGRTVWIPAGCPPWRSTPPEGGGDPPRRLGGQPAG